MQKNTKQLAVLSLEDGLALISGETRRRVLVEGGPKVIVRNRKLQTFVYNGIKCKHCGVEGSFFVVEQHMQQEVVYNTPFLNLYGRNKHGAPVLMTSDHILPKSKGGTDAFANLQTLCSKCNHKKGDCLEEELSYTKSCLPKRNKRYCTWLRECYDLSYGE